MTRLINLIAPHMNVKVKNIGLALASKIVRMVGGKTVKFDSTTSNYDCALRLLSSIPDGKADRDVKEIIYTMARHTGHYISRMPKRKEQ
ncbi:MAG: hypothetical protein LLG40_13955 [Deltaproteobacteria bacterium]|nr:hypothetical protein [Deltaproteobacteria bacterium]